MQFGGSLKRSEVEEKAFSWSKKKRPREDQRRFTNSVSLLY